MDRDRKTLKDDLERMSNKFYDCIDVADEFYDHQKYTVDRDRLFLEVLLDMRDELRSIRQTQGVNKWSPKL